MTLEIFMNDAKKAERKLGREEGQIVRCVQQVCKKLRKGKTVHEIAEDLEENEEEIQKIVDAAKRYAPDYDEEKICQELLAENTLPI